MKIRVNNNVYSLDKSFQFSGGEVQIRLPEMFIQQADTVYVTTVLDSPTAIMEMLLVDSALVNVIPAQVKTILEIYYMPYARQDRVCYKGEANSASVIHQLLDGTSFDYIRFADLHSKQEYMNDRFIELTQLDIFNYNPSILANIDVIVSPDKGATEKANAIAKQFGLELSQSLKVRDPENGDLKDITIDPTVDLKDKHLMIVDDICDGGGTFIWTAKELLKREPMSVSLYVTHGIFSKGTDCLFASGIFHIFTTNSFYKQDPVHRDKRITVIKL